VTLVPDAYREQLGIEGVAIAEVAPGGPAARAGLQGVRITRTRRLVLGDRIVAVDGKAVRSEDDLLDAFEAAGVGKTVTLTVARGTTRREVKVTLVQVE
jgi:S1-C subfamily serine protease